MLIEQTIVVLSLAGAVGCAGYFALNLIFGQRDARLYGRLKNERSAEDAAAKPERDVRAFASRLGSMAAQPFMSDNREKMGSLRKQLAMAGIYSPSSIRAVTGFKLILLLSGLTMGTLIGMMTDFLLMGLSMGGLVGYMLPTMWLRGKINANQKAVQYGLPDALDLMVVCVEAGLTMDAAMQRVGEELAIAHPVISREFGIAHMETRIGLSRAEALKNMGLRTGNAPLQQLVAMLVQAERFGTSVADALRIQSETLRIKRQHVAEELAAKASVKMSFPLVLFIFPATFIVLAGPTVLGLMKSDMFK